ncbi:MAG: hypothetical protein WBM32_12745 [Crocosphaera sp.]
MNLNSSPNNFYDDNIALIYDYVEKSLDILGKNISDVTNKLGLLAGIEVTLMRFFLADLPSPSFSDMMSNNIKILPCYSCFILKILAYIFIITSIIICLWEGYLTQPIRLVIPPKQLLEQAKEGTITQYKEAIINNIWKYSLEEANQLLGRRSKALRKAIISLFMSMIFAGLGIIIHFVFYT